MNTLKFTAIALIAASATLFADEGTERGIKPYLALGLTLPQGDARDLTQSSIGINNWSAEAGFEFFSTIAGIHFRPNVGMAKMYGEPKPETWPYNTYKMLGWYVGCDLIYKNPRGWPVILSTGPSFHVWNVEEAHTLATRSYGPQDIRLGWRGAVHYEVTEHWGVELSYSMSEWRTVNNQPHQPGLNPSRPVWFTLKGVYKF